MPLDWHRDPTFSASVPRSFWATVPYLDAERVGDHKVIWEVNRHQWVMWLAQDAFLRGDASMALQVTDLLRDWCAANPRSTGINWVSSLELAYRGIAWVQIARLLEGTESWRDAAPTVLASLRAQCLHVERHLSTWFSPNTHLTGEALGLMYVAVAFPQWRESARWLALGRQVLRSELTVQVRSDGTYFEQSTWYQGYTADIYLHYLLLEEWSGSGVPDDIRERVTRCVDALITATFDDGSIVRIGDEDGGRLLPVSTHSFSAFSDTVALSLALGLNVHPRPALSAAAAASDAPAWLGVASAASRSAEVVVPDMAPLGGTCQLHPDGGLARIDMGEWMVLSRFGPHGALTGAHAHADQQSVSVAFRGHPIAVDPGTAKYTTSIRDVLRGPASHNVATWYGGGSAEPAGPFGWQRRFDSRLMARWSEATLEAIDLRTEIVSTTQIPVAWRRMLAVTPRGVVVLDRVHGEEAGAAAPLSVHWILAPELSAVQEEQAIVLAHEPATPSVGLYWPAQQSASQLTTPFSPRYGETEPTTRVTLSGAGSNGCFWSLSVFSSSGSRPLIEADDVSRTWHVSWGDESIQVAELGGAGSEPEDLQLVWGDLPLLPQNTLSS
jgi:hypothetical protein